MSREFSQLEKNLNYHFHKPDLMKEALTHPSFAIEKNLPYNNQRLEFLGDAVLDVIMAEELYCNHPDADEGVMTKVRSAMVCQDALAQLAQDLSLYDFLLLGRGERMEGGAFRKSMLADAFEALMGAVYLDGGMDELKKITYRLFHQEYPDPMQVASAINPKGSLQEYSQAKWGETPEYSIYRVSGPEHKPECTVEVRLHGYVALGKSCSRKGAEGEAARSLLKFLEEGKEIQ